MIRTEKELRSKIETCKGTLKCKFEGTNGKRSIIVCGGTGCLSSDSAAIIAEIQKQIVERGLQDKVTVNKVGCFGFCSQGPFVKIFPEDTLYRGVKVEDVNDIFEEDILNNRVVERLLYKDPITGGLIQKQEDINFYKKQLRIALHGCGTINPEEIDEALGEGGKGGFWGPRTVPFQGFSRTMQHLSSFTTSSKIQMMMPQCNPSTLMRRTYSKFSQGI